MSSGGSIDRSEDSEKKGSVVDIAVHVAVANKEVDTAAQLATGLDELSPEEALRIRKKIDWHIMPLMCTLYWIQFMDKTTLGSSAILGIRTATHLTTNQYNWLGTIFYILSLSIPRTSLSSGFPSENG